MKQLLHALCSIGTLLLLTLSGCQSYSNGSTQTAASTKHRPLGQSKNAQSKHVAFSGPQEEEFIPLEENDLHSAFAEGAIAQPKFSPGEEGSGLPSIASFEDPHGELSTIFSKIHFNTDDHVVRGQDNLKIIYNIAAYLRDHPDLFVFIEGHCDKRAPEAYNLALGTRRANYVRTLLIRHGIDLSRLHTVSYGKEKPLYLGDTPQDWAKNRRAQFKIYNR